MSLIETKPSPRIHFGPGAINVVDTELHRIGAKKILIVTDPGIMHVGHPGNLQLHLEDQGYSVEVFDKVVENPTTETVADCVEFARNFGAELLIGLGGGSSMDTAKGCNFILTNGGEMKDYWGYGKAEKPMLPFIAIPTTAGTGSECQSYALISDAVDHQKMACGDPKALAVSAILDPELTLTQPPFVAACTGIDAISHAIESAVTLRRTPFSNIYSREAFRLLQENLETVFDEPDNLHARGQVLLGAAYAGIAIENSMLGCAHSAANPLTAHYDTVHGNAVGLTLPHAMLFNSENPEALTIYARLALESRLAHRDDSEQEAFDALHARILELLDWVDFPLTLRELNAKKEDIPTLAKEAAGQWTAQFNPRPITEEDFVKFYEEAY